MLERKHPDWQDTRVGTPFSLFMTHTLRDFLGVVLLDVELIACEQERAIFRKIDLHAA